MRASHLREKNDVEAGEELFRAFEVVASHGAPGTRAAPEARLQGERPEASPVERAHVGVVRGREVRGVRRREERRRGAIVRRPERRREQHAFALEDGQAARVRCVRLLRPQERVVGVLVVAPPPLVFRGGRIDDDGLAIGVTPRPLAGVGAHEAEREGARGLAMLAQQGDAAVPPRDRARRVAPGLRVAARREEHEERGASSPMKLPIVHHREQGDCTHYFKVAASSPAADASAAGRSGAA